MSNDYFIASDQIIAVEEGYTERYRNYTRYLLDVSDFLLV
jgi:hypothetical protein